MKREEKNASARRRILDAALRELSEKGYHASSLNTICSENKLSKGIIYHYFQDKDQLYLQCAQDCYDHLTAYLEQCSSDAASTEERLCAYFDARSVFFAENTVYLGIFLDTMLTPPPHLSKQLEQARAAFDALNLSILTDILEGAALRPGFTAGELVSDFKMYMDYFNARFKTRLATGDTPREALAEHEKQCHRQLSIFLHGALVERNE